MAEQKIGLSLSDLPVSKLNKKSSDTSGDLIAYSHDMKRSLLIGGIALLLEVAVYFSGILK